MSRVLRQIRALHFGSTAILCRTRRKAAVEPANDSRWQMRPFDHDAIKRNRIMISSLCLSMIFSENRFPLFRIMLSVVAGGSSLRRHGEHDDDKAEHRQSHEFEYQRVHGNSPIKPLDL
jgi:hypothetical protein